MKTTNIDLFIRELNRSIDIYGMESISPQELLDLAEAIKSDLQGKQL